MMKLTLKKTDELLQKVLLCLLLICVNAGVATAQETGSSQILVQEFNPTGDGQITQFPNIPNKPSSVALKTNLLYAATLTPNLALEIGLGKKTTLEIGGGCNFYDPDNGKNWKHWLVQPEFRWWFCERFNGSFLGVHALGGEYNFAKIDLPLSVFSDLKDYRYDGYFYGAGVVFGHQWILGKRWSLEASVGVGYVRVHYDKYNCASCGGAIKSGVKNYWGPTKAALSFIFFL